MFGSIFEQLGESLAGDGGTGFARNWDNPFHEKAGECQGFSIIFLFFLSSLFLLFPNCFPLSQVASVATLPSALFVERLSLGASWVYSIQ